MHHSRGHLIDTTHRPMFNNEGAVSLPSRVPFIQNISTPPISRQSNSSHVTTWRMRDRILQQRQPNIFPSIYSPLLQEYDQ